MKEPLKHIFANIWETLKEAIFFTLTLKEQDCTPMNINVHAIFVSEIQPL